MQPRYATGVLGLALALGWGAAGAGTERTTDPDTGRSTWHSTDSAFYLELIPLLPDFVRAVYEARGLPDEVIEDMAGYCVFGSIARNDGDDPLSYDVSDWRFRVRGSGQWRPVKTKAQWLAEWRARGINFAWTLLPTAQTFAPGDWGQGFLSLEVPHGTVVDLRYSWQQRGEPQRTLLVGLQCAGDAGPEPSP